MLASEKSETIASSPQRLLSVLQGQNRKDLTTFKNGQI